MKRSAKIKLVLISGLSSAVLSGCEPPQAVSTQNFYTNNCYVPGAGYYHAPFRQWYILPYNYLDPKTGLYFFGGKWGQQPLASITNISAPTYEAVQVVESTRTDISRGGFGGYGGGYYGSGFHA